MDFLRHIEIANRVFLLGIVAVLFSCENQNSRSILESSENEIEADLEDDFELAHWKNPNPNIDDDTNHTVAFMKMMNWNENISIPSKSSIHHFKFKRDFLFQYWASSHDEPPVFSFNFEYFSVPNEGNYLYTVHGDSLRIFTAYERPGDGHERGIIQNLTKDSLIILFSEGVLVKYVSVNSP
jgi:hypothetical protein